MSSYATATPTRRWLSAPAQAVRPGSRVGRHGIQPLVAILDANGISGLDIVRGINCVTRGTVGYWLRGMDRPHPEYAEKVRAYVSERIGVELIHEQLWSWPERVDENAKEKKTASPKRGRRASSNATSEKSYDH